MTQPDLFDSRLVALRHADGQAEQIERVSDRIAGAVLEFANRNCGLEAHAEQLVEFVREKCGHVAPDSPGRILRMLKARGEISYTVDRAKSLYRFGV